MASRYASLLEVTDGFSIRFATRSDGFQSQSQCSVFSVQLGVGSFDYYSFMCLNILLRRPTYNSLYDLYVYKLNATDRDAWQHDKRDVDFFATD